MYDNTSVCSKLKVHLLDFVLSFQPYLVAFVDGVCSVVMQSKKDAFINQISTINILYLKRTSLRNVTQYVIQLINRINKYSCHIPIKYKNIFHMITNVCYQTVISFLNTIYRSFTGGVIVHKYINKHLECRHMSLQLHYNVIVFCKPLIIVYCI